MSEKTGWIAGIARGHNSGVCLLKDGEIVFSIEEERLTRSKYDGGPLSSILKIKEYTDKIDYLVVSHTTPLATTAGLLDYTGEDVYTGLARKLGLIDPVYRPGKHPQVVDMAMLHHKMHASMSFYRSGFDEAVAVVIDGAGTFFPIVVGGEQLTVFETESIFKCSYPNNIQTVHKTLGAKDMLVGTFVENFDASGWEQDASYDVFLNDRAGLVKAYEAVTEYCGWSSIEAGKTMGLSPYGKVNKDIPSIIENDNTVPIPTTNRNLIVPRYPNGAVVNAGMYDFLTQSNTEDLTTLENRRDLAFAVQEETQQAAADLIRHAVKKTGLKNVVVSGGYGLNCVANYFYLDELKNEGINIYVEPISNDAGTAMGAALLQYHSDSRDIETRPRQDNVYLGPEYQYTIKDILEVSSRYNGIVTDATHNDVVDLITSKNIVSLFQGRSENGPRALGNRSLIFDPTFKDGKDYVNSIKRREYFRPFAGSILEEEVHDWFDLRGMDTSPTMMYAVNCLPGIADIIPSIIHVDNTCRIQTVNETQNYHYYQLIKTFKQRTGIPMVFNTSFNLGGEPLVETLEDALWTLQQSDIEYLYLPEYGKLITLGNR